MKNFMKNYLRHFLIGAAEVTPLLGAMVKE